MGEMDRDEGNFRGEEKGEKRPDRARDEQEDQLLPETRCPTSGDAPMRQGE